MVDDYKKAGVDVEKGDRLVDWLQTTGGTKSNSKYGSPVSGIGGFAALYRPNFQGMKDPLLVTSTDGVGTKVLLGLESKRLTGLGQDLVAMCVNDLYTVGGRPLFFLDYYATGAIDEAQFKDVLNGIRAGCAQSEALLLGGETAEMPGLYEKGHFDLAGFVVGVVDGAAMLGAHAVKTGDLLYALPSSGFHSNGYSLVRHWLKAKAPSDDLLSHLMTPTKIYSEVPLLVDNLGISQFHALANITGGGISGNLPRVLPSDVVAHISKSAIPTPLWMKNFIELHGSNVMSQEGVFNLGCGMIAVIAKEAKSAFESQAPSSVLIGDIKAGSGEARVEYH